MKKSLLSVLFVLLFVVANLAQPSNYEFEVSRGNIPGVSSGNKFGKNLAVTTAEDIWQAGGIFASPTTAGVVNFASSSAVDTAAGTGARTLQITGVDTNWLSVTETITLRGTTNVPTVNKYWGINRVLVLTAGTGATNAGTITGTSTGTGTPVLATIVIGKAQTQQCIYFVPAGYTAYITRLNISQTNSTSTATLQAELFIKPFGGVFNIKNDLSLGQAGTNAVEEHFDTPIIVTEKSIVKITATPSAGSATVSAEFDYFLVKNKTGLR